MTVDVVILAAGKGTRMRSQLSKVLHPLAGKPLLHHVLDTANALNPRQMLVVVGHQADAVRASVGARASFVEQAEQNGTGHAVQLAMPQIADDGVVLVLYGDVPLVEQATMQAAIDSAVAGRIGLVVADFVRPDALGRIVRDVAGEIQAIVEYKDASPAQREITEINSGIMAIPAAPLRGWLANLKADNAQAEYYLTDVIAMAVADGVAVDGIFAGSEDEVTGVNDRAQLARLERAYQAQQTAALMAAGVTMADPARVDIRGTLRAGEDCFIDINTVFEGTVSLGRDVHIGPGAVIIDSQLADRVTVHPHTVVEGAMVGADASLGPFARVRPGSNFGAGVKIGNFVETKKATLGDGTKASHLAYLGDATIGDACNIGAGTVTCNYDGINKHPTHIGDNVFVGTNSTLVAPLEIETDAFVGAGSTVTTKVEAGDLAVGRAKQRNIKGWTRPDQRD
ncbi:MAG: bifunctional UDP-N-acetylglucosamine diphosphorylase/glucosamine-1-phosphate N-acetyltransferase GlmU [Pseudomonadota bacterium]